RTLAKSSPAIPISRSPRRLSAERIPVLRLEIWALSVMDGGGAVGELTAQEMALYDRLDPRLWRGCPE
ncbi:unnamed protein product, partial [Urochloa humidicola]